jgi:Pyridoxamine 5'-phosphate oxidase
MLVLTDEFKAAINNSLADGAPILMAAVQADGQPWMAFRGSAHAHADDQVGLWVRNTEGHTAGGIQTNNKVALFYRRAGGISFQIQGRARMVDDAALRQQIYDEAPEPERNADKEMKGNAMIVDVDRVIQRGRVVLARDESEVSAPVPS